jgi:hypothetical protein
MPWERSIGKASASKLKIYAKNDGRYQISWYDLAGKRHVATRGTLAAAKSFQTQKIAELQRHRETKFDSEDRQMSSEARELALDHGCTVLQAVREWHRTKGGSSNSELLGKAIQKFLAAKRTRSPAYIDKLNADMRLVQSHFGADRPIDRIQSKEIEDFLDLKKATGRRRNNLRSEIITLFRYAQARLSALPRDRKTEAEFVMKDQEKSKSVETFSPQEFEMFLGAVRPDWLEWLPIGGPAGVRTDGEIFRTNWEFFKWDQRQIDLPKEATKNNERRLVPICDRLFNILQPLRRDSGPVISLKKPEDETARLRRVTDIPWRRNALRHSFCSYRVAITRNIPLVSIESGNSPQMIKSNYWDLKRPEEGFKWFGTTLPILAERRQEPFLMHLPLTSFSP